MKIFNILFILLFIVSAALQYNDPDPYLWMPIYLWAAFLCYQAIKGKYNRYAYLVTLTLYTVYAGFLFFSATGVQSWFSEHNAENLVQSMKATKPWIEETREFFGLMITCGVLFFNMLWYSRKQRINVPVQKTVVSGN
jgi:hypothetical protein